MTDGPGLLGGEPPRPAVLMCPPLVADEPLPPWWADLVDGMRQVGISALAPAVGHPANPGPATDERLELAGWVADLLMATAALPASVPLILVTTGSGSRGLTALSLAQRAARRAVVGYVIVDGPVPQTSRHAPDWPEAPVQYLRTADAPELDEQVARRRGWVVRRGDPVQLLVAYASAWPDPEGVPGTQ